MHAQLLSQVMCGSNLREAITRHVNLITLPRLLLSQTMRMQQSQSY
jgi:hypothetical protein